MEITTIKNLSLNHVTTFAFKCAVDLDIAGCIQAYGRAMPLNELARSIPIVPEKESMLRRLMALLVHQGVFGQSEAGYLLTPVSELILTDGPNMGALVRYTANIAEVFKGWSRMSELFKDTGTCTIFQKAFGGKKFWEVTKETVPELGTLFNEAMASQSMPVMRSLVATYPHIFDSLHSLVDVGGGNGAAIKVIAEAFPGLRCTVFDLPHVVATISKNNSFDVIGGDMFEEIPQADGIFLKNVLHDWNDEDCIRILSQCKKAITSSKYKCGKVIVVDIIMGLESADPKTVEAGLLADITMMCYVAAKERTKQEWHDIILAAGYSTYNMYPGQFGPDSVIEIHA